MRSSALMFMGQYQLAILQLLKENMMQQKSVLQHIAKKYEVPV